MQSFRKVLVALSVVAGAVAFLGFVGLPWFRKALGLDAKDMRVTVLSTSDEIDAVVAEMEIAGPYGMESISELTVGDDAGKPVKFNWGDAAPERYDFGSRTKYIVRKSSFPADFRQGKLLNKDIVLCSFKVPRPAFDSSVNILSASEKEIAAPGAGGKTVQKIAAEMELVFPIGTAPASVKELRVVEDDESPVEVDWGADASGRFDLNGKTTLIVRECFFPSEFKRGKLFYGEKAIYYLKMPELPFTAPAGK